MTDPVMKAFEGAGIMWLAGAAKLFRRAAEALDREVPAPTKFHEPHEAAAIAVGVVAMTFGKTPGEGATALRDAAEALDLVVAAGLVDSPQVHVLRCGFGPPGFRPACGAPAPRWIYYGGRVPHTPVCDLHANEFRTAGFTIGDAFSSVPCRCGCLALEGGAP